MLLLVAAVVFVAGDGDANGSSIMTVVLLVAFAAVWVFYWQLHNDHL